MWLGKVRVSVGSRVITKAIKMTTVRMTVTHWASCSCTTPVGQPVPGQLYRPVLMPTLTGEEPGVQREQAMRPKPHSQSMAEVDGNHALLISHLGPLGSQGMIEKREALVLMRSRANPRPLAASQLSLLPGQLSPWQWFTASSKAPSSLSWCHMDTRCLAVHGTWEDYISQTPLLVD